MEFLKWLGRTIEGFGQNININRIPLYHFPEYLAKSCLELRAIEAWDRYYGSPSQLQMNFTYRTIRQNIIDGLSREQFLISKMLTNFILSAVSMLLVFSHRCLLPG
ncbi:MAG: hypothetical protein WDN75_15245 [Bacteroidota bacterium]